MYCCDCGSKMKDHEMECIIDDCELTKHWYINAHYCPKCDDFQFSNIPVEE